MKTFSKPLSLWLALAGLCLIGSLSASAGQPITPVAVSGDEAPATGAAFDYFEPFAGSPGLNEASEVQSNAVLTGIGVNTTSDSALLSFAEGVSYQRAIEEVYWRHRIWPLVEAY